MNDSFDIQKYVTGGVERVVRDALRAALTNPAQTAYLVQFALASKKASARRQKSEEQGEHIPPFLLASITSSCNLHCKGCFSRQIGSTEDCPSVDQLSGADWAKIFREADELGISFIFLVGGEPLLRKDVVLEAANYPGILFPIITNGVFMNDFYFDLFAKKRNLVPVMSIEGGRKTTDERRGSGIYDRLTANMDSLKKRSILWGASITVTSENLEDVTSDAFLRELADHGCRAVLYVEFVPVTEDSLPLALNEEQQQRLRDREMDLRENMPQMVFISFPGDEKASGGCIAAGRGFFHINSHGGAEPCPFSPYSDINVRSSSLREALKSPLFLALQEGDLLKDDHVGGCTLYTKQAEVEKITRRLAEAQPGPCESRSGTASRSMSGLKRVRAETPDRNTEIP